jgi:hypothetical protein
VITKLIHQKLIQVEDNSEWEESNKISPIVEIDEESQPNEE